MKRRRKSAGRERVGDAPQFDDITMLAIRYDGPKKDGPEKRAKEE